VKSPSLDLKKTSTSIPRRHGRLMAASCALAVLVAMAFAACSTSAESPEANPKSSRLQKVEQLNALEGKDDYFVLMKKLAIPDRRDLPQLFVSGDSISQHYAPSLKVALLDKINVTHWMDLPTRFPKAVPKTPYSGTSQLLIEMLTAVLNCEDYHPQFLLLNAGLHDATYEIPTAVYRAHLIEIVELANKHHAKMMWVQTTPREKGDSHNALIEAYNIEARKIMDERHVPVIDLDKFAADLIAKDGEQATFNGDGLHFSNKARNMMGAYLGEKLLEILKNDLTPQKESHTTTR
jgi:lysophospholipase L1-like esterase